MTRPLCNWPSGIHKDRDGICTRCGSISYRDDVLTTRDGDTITEVTVNQEVFLDTSEIVTAETSTLATAHRLMHEGYNFGRNFATDLVADGIEPPGTPWTLSSRLSTLAVPTGTVRECHEWATGFRNGYAVQVSIIAARIQP